MRRMFSKKQIENQADARITALVEGGTLENAKPLYFHPVILLDSTNTAGFSMIIVDNNPEPYDTWAKLKAKLTAIAVASGETSRFPVAGSFVKDEVQVIARNIDVSTLGAITVYGYDVNASAQRYATITNYVFSNMFDNVIKIN